MSERIVQTAGRNQLGEFAPMFAHLNDDVLFGEVWNEEAIDVKTKCIITVVSLMASGITDSSLIYHLQNAKNHGVTKEEIASIITHATMYVGYPIWWGEEPRIMDTFVESYNFDGITLIPFCTSGGSGIGRSGQNLAENAGSGTWLDGERFDGGVSEDELSSWIDSLQ